MDRIPTNTSDGKAGAGHKTHRARPEPQRDVLPFPRGGVFGPASGASLEQIHDALTIARGLEHALDRMQSQLDELNAELDDPYVFPFAQLADNPDDTRPIAA